MLLRYVNICHFIKNNVRIIESEVFMALDKIVNIRKTDKNVLEIDHGVIKKGWEMSYILSADRHKDHPNCQHELDEKHLQLAIDNDWGIIDFGDLHCAMQGKDYPRRDKKALRERFKTRAYWDELTDFVTESYGHVADRWIAQFYGNHETSILEKNEVDLIQRFAACMNSQYSGLVNTMGYSGYIVFRFGFGSARKRVILYGTHGHNSGGKATQGVSGVMRLNHNIEGADIMCLGHTHNSYYVDYVKEMINNKGRLVETPRYIVQIPTYKRGTSEDRLSWEDKRGIGSKPLGAWRLRFYWVSRREPIGIELTRLT